MADAPGGPRARVVCLDVDGTLTDGVMGPALPGAVEAVSRLRRAFPLRLVSNTTSLSHRKLASHLRGLGLCEDASELYTPARAAREVLPPRGHDSGVLLLEPAAEEDFGWFRRDSRGPVVLLGTEGHRLRVGDLQSAFRRLLDGGVLYTLQRNRYFAKGGELVTDLGPLAAFLSYASGRDSIVLGKPSAFLFDAIAGNLGVARQRLVMVGDDAEVDVAESISLGMAGVLMRTGKYREGDEARVNPAPTAVLDSVADLPGWLLGGL